MKRPVIHNLRSDHTLKRELSPVVFMESHGFREKEEEEEEEEVEETVRRERGWWGGVGWGARPLASRPTDRQTVSQTGPGTAGEVNLSARELACQAG